MLIWDDEPPEVLTLILGFLDEDTVCRVIHLVSRLWLRLSRISNLSHCPHRRYLAIVLVIGSTRRGEVAGQQHRVRPLVHRRTIW